MSQPTVTEPNTAPASEWDFAWLQTLLNDTAEAWEAIEPIFGPLAPFGLTFGIFKFISLSLQNEDDVFRPMGQGAAALYGAAIAVPLALIWLDVIGILLMIADQLRERVIEHKASIGFINFARRRRQALRRRYAPRNLAAGTALSAALLFVLAVITSPIWQGGERSPLAGHPLAAAAPALHAQFIGPAPPSVQGGEPSQLQGEQ